MSLYMNNMPVRVCPIKDIECSTPGECQKAVGKCKLEPQPEPSGAVAWRYRHESPLGSDKWGDWELCKLAPVERAKAFHIQYEALVPASDLSDLKHDIERSVATNAELATELEKAREELERTKRERDWLLLVLDDKMDKHSMIAKGILEEFVKRFPK